MAAASSLDDFFVFRIHTTAALLLDRGAERGRGGGRGGATTREGREERSRESRCSPLSYKFIIIGGHVPRRSIYYYHSSRLRPSIFRVGAGTPPPSSPPTLEFAPKSRDGEKYIDTPAPTRQRI
jgi:hypothetical protein